MIFTRATCSSATSTTQANTQGTGTTIVQVSPGGAVSQFAGISDSACPGGVGLTTALVVLRSGWVIVGSLPTQNGSISGSGCLIVLDSHGAVRETLTGHGINGPWDMTALDLGGITELFVTNVLNGLARHRPARPSRGRCCGSSSPADPSGCRTCWRSPRSDRASRETLNHAALVIGPTGVGLGPNGTLYVADTLDNRIAAIPNAVLRHTDDGLGQTVSAGRQA